MSVIHKTDPETGSHIFEYYKGNEVVGYAYGKIEGTHFEVESIWVQPQHRRQHVGTELLNNIMTFATERKISNVFLEFNPEPYSDAEGAKKFYEGFGIRDEGSGIYRGSTERR